MAATRSYRFVRNGKEEWFTERELRAMMDEAGAAGVLNEETAESFWCRLEMEGGSADWNGGTWERTFCTKCKVNDPDESDEECPECLAKPRCTECRDFATVAGKLCDACASRCNECNKLFKPGDVPPVLLVRKHFAVRLHVECCAEEAMKLALDAAEDAAFRETGLAALRIALPYVARAVADARETEESAKRWHARAGV